MEQDGFFKDIYEAIGKLRNANSGLVRYGHANEEGKVLSERKYVCYAECRRGSVYQTAPFFFLAWNGDAPGKAVPCAWQDDGGGRDHPEARDSKYRPGPLSDAWLEFILNPEISPWKPILPHLVSTDPVIIRESGIIIRDPKAIKFHLFYNFLIATRYAYEFSHRAAFWFDLINNHGVDPRAAYLLSMGYKKNGKGVKPPLRKVLVKDGGYRKNAGGFRYIRDEYGEKKYFPAEYTMVDDNPDWKDEWDGGLTKIACCNHTPLPDCFGYIKRILTSDPNLGVSDIASAWDIFKGKEPEYEGMSNLKDVLEFFNTVKGK